MKLGNFNFKIFENYKKNPKNIGYQHQNWTKTREDIQDKVADDFWSQKWGGGNNHY